MRELSGVVVHPTTGANTGVVCRFEEYWQSAPEVVVGAPRPSSSFLPRVYLQEVGDWAGLVGAGSLVIDFGEGRTLRTKNAYESPGAEPLQILGVELSEPLRAFLGW